MVPWITFAKSEGACSIAPAFIGEILWLRLKDQELRVNLIQREKGDLARTSWVSIINVWKGLKMDAAMRREIRQVLLANVAKVLRHRLSLMQFWRRLFFTVFFDRYILTAWISSRGQCTLRQFGPHKLVKPYGCSIQDVKPTRSAAIVWTVLRGAENKILRWRTGKG